MAHCAKYSAGASGHLAKHYERAKNEKGEYIKFKNQDIDSTRSHLNYNLAPQRDQVAYICQRTSEVRCLKRKDVNVMCSWVVTFPKFKSFNTDKSIHKTYSDDYAERVFFERCYKFLADRYGGEQNVISSYVHKDEATPHMHFAFIPIVKDKKRGDLKVSAKDVITIHELNKFHTDLKKHLDSFRDIDFEILNDATKDGNKSTEELKNERRASEAENKAIKAEERLNTLLERENTLKSEISALQTTKKTLTKAEIKDLKSHRTLFGGLKGVTFNEFEAIKRTAEQVDEMKVEVKRCSEAEEYRQRTYKAKIDEVRNEVRKEYAEQLTSLQRDVNTLVQDKSSLYKEIGQLERKVERQASVIDFLKSVITEKLPEFAKSVESKVKEMLFGKNQREK